MLRSLLQVGRATALRGEAPQAGGGLVRGRGRVRKGGGRDGARIRGVGLGRGLGVGSGLGSGIGFW